MNIEENVRIINILIDVLPMTPEQLTALYNAQWWLLFGNPATDTALLHEIAEPLQGTTAGLILQDIL